jgi:hypothetical protein
MCNADDGVAKLTHNEWDQWSKVIHIQGVAITPNGEHRRKIIFSLSMMKGLLLARESKTIYL